MRRRHFYLALSNDQPLCFEDWMSEPTQQAIPTSARSERGFFRRLAAVVIAALALLGIAKPAAAQTLTEALSYAYNSNPQLLAQRALLRQTDEGVPQALSNWRPTVTFTGQAGYSRSGFQEQDIAACTGGTPGKTCFSSFETRSLNLQLTQPIYRGGRTEAQTRQA